MKNRYYAVYGNNGLGVYTDYNRVLVAKEYLGKGFKVKGYADREEAVTRCIGGYNDLQENVDACYMGNELTMTNFTIYRKKIKEQNLKGGIVV